MDFSYFINIATTILITILIIVVTINTFKTLITKKNNRNNIENNKLDYQALSINYLKNNNITLENLEKLFIIDECFILNRENTTVFIVTGMINKGNIKIGDSLNYIDENLQLKSLNITGVEKFRQQLSEGHEGENVGLRISINTKLPKNLFLFKIKN